MLKRVISFLLAVTLLLALLPVNVQASGAYEGKTVVLYTGNIRGDVTLLPYIAAARAHFEAQGADVILADTGNFLQGTRYSTFNSGSTMITLMVAAGYDVVALGVYDFAFGTGTLGTAFHGDAIDFGPLGDLLAANPSLRALSANISGANAYFHSFAENLVIETAGGLQIGFFGRTNAAVSASLIEPVFEGLTLSTQSTSVMVRDQVAALAHTDVVVGLSNSRLLTAPGAILLEAPVVHVPGTPSVGVVIIDNATLTYEMRDINLAAFTPDAELAAMVDEFRAVVNDSFAWVGTSEVTLRGSFASNRRGETNLGNFWADALRWFAVSGEINNFFGEDDVAIGNDRIHVPEENIVALWNAGNLRDFIRPGDVTLTDLRRVLPFPNTVAVIYLTGAELLEQLEASSQGLPFSDDTFALTAAFMHVSGIHYTVDAWVDFNRGEPFRDRIWYTAASVERVTIHSINGRPFDLNATYAVITSNANFNGMDISYVLTERVSDVDFLSTITTARVTDDAVAGFIASLPDMTIGREYDSSDGRITVRLFPITTLPIFVRPRIQMTLGEYGLTSTTSFNSFGEITYTSNFIASDAAAFIDADNRVMIPLRAVAEAMFARVEWVRETTSAVIAIPLLNRTITVDVDAQLVINGRTFVTVDFIEEAFNMRVRIDGSEIYFYRA